MTPEPQDREYDPERDDPPADLNVYRVALSEISKIVGNENVLYEGDCADLRGILFAALSAPTNLADAG